MSERGGRSLVSCHDVGKYEQRKVHLIGQVQLRTRRAVQCLEHFKRQLLEPFALREVRGIQVKHVRCHFEIADLAVGIAFVTGSKIFEYPAVYFAIRVHDLLRNAELFSGPPARTFSEGSREKKFQCRIGKHFGTLSAASGNTAVPADFALQNGEDISNALMARHFPGAGRNIVLANSRAHILTV